MAVGDMILIKQAIKIRINVRTIANLHAADEIN